MVSLLARAGAVLIPLAAILALNAGCRALQGDYLADAAKSIEEAAPRPKLEVRDMAAEEKARYLEAHAAFGAWWATQVEGNLWLERLESDDDVSGTWDADPVSVGEDGLPNAYVAHYYYADGGTGVLVKAAGCRGLDGAWDWTLMGSPRRSLSPNQQKRKKEGTGGAM